MEALEMGGGTRHFGGKKQQNLRTEYIQIDIGKLDITGDDDDDV